MQPQLIHNTKHNQINRMKKSFHTAFLGLSVLGALWLAPQAGATTTIYADNFPGSSSNPLNGTTPATESGMLGGTSGIAWNAATGGFFNADGSVNTSAGSGSADLPFTPQSGEIYTLSATVNDTAGWRWGLSMPQTRPRLSRPRLTTAGLGCS
jgi:hypothetical protein